MSTSATAASATNPQVNIAAHPPPTSSAAAAPATTAPNGGDTGGSIMQQVAAQERRIADLTRQLEEKNTKLDRFQTAKRQEMEALLTGLKEWLTKLGLASDNDRAEVEKGLQRLVNNGADDNGIWRVMVTASANARQREDEYQQLKTQYEELQKRQPAVPMPGSEFDSSDARVGSKRPADADPPSESVGDIWSAFIADVSSTGYGIS